LKGKMAAHLWPSSSLANLNTAPRRALPDPPRRDMKMPVSSSPQGWISCESVCATYSLFWDQKVDHVSPAYVFAGNVIDIVTHGAAGPKKGVIRGQWRKHIWYLLVQSNIPIIHSGWPAARLFSMKSTQVFPHFVVK
jgi:hypothetical protein